MNKEYVLEKLAFIVANPFEVENQKELESATGYAKEWGNKVISGLAGLGIGAAAAIPLVAIGTVSKKPALQVMGALAAPTLVPLGGITSSIRSIRETERGAGVEP